MVTALFSARPGRWDPVVPVAVSGEWPDDPDERAELLARRDPVCGDRDQELVFIGVGLDAERLHAALGEHGWRELSDPFPR
ncbi:GTP-binding protein [Micromonospora sp. SL1-18]|uniref:GTP-binding protein n=1 Tax=Micromonospora sp. SL1-18 TaxID=3399128 RepID=UPI003A4DD719